MKLVSRHLAHKLIFWLTIVSGVMAIVSSIVHVKTQERQILHTMVQGADQLSRSITSATWHAMLADLREDAYAQMRMIATTEGIDRIRIINKEGRVMYSTRPNDEPAVDKNADPCSKCHSTTRPRLILSTVNRARIFRGPDGHRRLAMVTPVYNEPSCSQAVCHVHPENTRVLGVLDVTMTLDPMDRELRTLEARVLLITLIHIVLIGLVIVLFSRHFVDKPLDKLRRATRAVSAMNLDQKIEIHSSEELEELARSFNAMREKLKENVDEINQINQSLETKVEERTQQLRLAHQKLLQSDRLASLGQLAASMAHEINNPVAGVLNLSMLIQRIMTDEGIPPARIAEVRRYLEQISNETTRVGRIVSNLLAFSRRSRPQSVDTDLNTLIRNTLLLVSHKLELGNVVAETRLADDLPRVRCDGSQMQQVILNLVMNGAEATASRKGGRVIVTTRLGPTGDTALLEVTDDGDGIPPDILPRIFDPFFTTKEEGKGVGLGLSVVYGILEAHGAEIEVDSAVGRGTTFRVTLPIQGAAMAPAPAAAGVAR